mmetsp:Transcript_12406/g.15389  ORF Transcript_12406/g.15389 Transcript_12406/m.15389 type:complete len:242 (+) Transcript_12406:151-876(+)|eukprot:CAMPEP_0204823264 /NCGR_PEP_ID=MMETSP1346-20131115/1331_1 /ASSEMBLY_ACC=CAM_ASM_000771 /TAXON_ID=215587 /ORGANISM="Aplanochytrium stocchinoi, Strain GSBS06" /LENGTH=241 /DNA_ID=CAMNT_0051949831 /DNA_START=124 /DNA_END=849 /DNA_ORIENTATION=+
MSKLPPEQQLNAVNGIITNIYAYDNVLRVITYSSILAAEGLKKIGYGESDLAKFLVEVFTKLTDARFVNRLGGLPATIAWFLAALRNGNSMESLLDKGMAASMLLYYPMEHVWYFSTYTSRFVKVNSNWWCLWYCRVWALYVVMDLANTYLRINQIKAALKSAWSDESNEAKKNKHSLTKQLYQSRLWAKIALCDFLMACQWSVEQGPLSDNFISLVGVYGGAANLYLKWLKAQPADEKQE